MAPTECTSEINYLLEDSSRQTDGVGPIIDVSSSRCKLLIITLCIDRALERESLAVSIWGSRDRMDWGKEPLLRFSEKCYCGMYSVLLNLATDPDIRYLQAQWRMQRWTKEASSPFFEFGVLMQPSGSRSLSAHA